MDPKILPLGDDEQYFANREDVHANFDDPSANHLNEEAEEISEERLIRIKYYEEFKKIYYTSYKLWAQFHKQLQLKEKITTRIHHLQAQLTTFQKTKRYQVEEEVQVDGEISSKRKEGKRIRRTAEKIQRRYYCTADFCDRCYGSQGSLQQHLKLKHPKLYKLEGVAFNFAD